MTDWIDRKNSIIYNTKQCAGL